MKRKKRNFLKMASTVLGDINEALEQIKASIRTFVEHPAHH